MAETVLIIGAGQAGLHAAASLRKRGFDGTIRLIGDEPYAPYQRPPLSKAFMKGDMSEERLAFKPPAFYGDQSIDLMTGEIVTGINRTDRAVTTDQGNQHTYDHLIIATGARPRTIALPGATCEGVFELRTLNDAKAMKRVMKAGSRLAVIGGGYIGLEAAAVGRQLGLNVIVFERMPHLLSRVTSEIVSSFFRDLHHANGVDIRCAAAIDSLAQDGTRVSGIHLDDGETIACDAVLMGVGVVPNIEIAAAAGLACDNGIIVDDVCRTSDPHIFAAGDCARRVLAPYGGAFRLESVHNALDQAERIAAALTNSPQPAFDPPWFWSDQYDVKLQTVGLFNGYTDTVIRGDISARKFSVFYFADDQLLAIDAVNDPASFLAGKQILKNMIPVTRATIADETVPLKSLLTPMKSA